MHDFSGAKIILIHKWHVMSYKRVSYDKKLLKELHQKVSPRYANEFGDDGISWELGKAIRQFFRTHHFYLEAVFLNAERDVFVCEVDNSTAGRVLDSVREAKRDWGFEGFVTFVKATTFAVHAKLSEVQRFWEEGNEAMPTSVFNVMKLDYVDIKARL